MSLRSTDRMQVEVFEMNEYGSYGTFYNILIPLIKSYVLFHTTVPQRVTQIRITVTNCNNGKYVVTLYTSNNTYIHVNQSYNNLYIRDPKYEINDIFKVNNFLSTDTFIKVIIRKIHPNENLIFGKEFKLDHDINKYQNECTFENIRNDVIYCNDEMNYELHRVQRTRHNIIEIEHTKTKLLQKKENILDMEYTIQKMITDMESSKKISMTLCMIILVLAPYYISSSCFSSVRTE